MNTSPTPVPSATKSVTGVNYLPTFHPDYAIGTHVEFNPLGHAPEHAGETMRGRITGVASVHAAFTYIVTLDHPIRWPGYEGWTTFAVMGTLIRPV